MDSFIIRGGNGSKAKSKSAAARTRVAILAVGLMSDEKVTLHGVPRLSDIDSMLKLVGELGCHVYRHEPKTKTCRRRAGPERPARSRAAR
jgi:UDP-N-acetylglucosamine enolpyruvyl transferase